MAFKVRAQVFMLKVTTPSFKLCDLEFILEVLVCEIENWGSYTVLLIKKL